ncbi:hypothetical protein N7472_009742 [Penicillium cf. griseofulvum]|uniref:NB-ARC domain-containing protein n=1 Tax=Penicillium cf. griseofulvum TaxID=2972120 RepID=A0A9W9IVY7_9EURO|nr:hypothetical protein N7472_009742 [Penicillium cf. griseofulvum]
MPVLSGEHPDDRETVETFKTCENAVEWLLGSTSPSLTLIRPALGHLHVFAKFFQVNLAADLNVLYLWGSLLVSKNLKALEEVPRMIKSLAFKAEAFNCYYTDCHVISNVMKEVCFDMQLQFANFFTSCIKHIRAAESDGYGYSLVEKGTRYQQRIQTQYEQATLVLGEALSRLKMSISKGVPGEDRPSVEMDITKSAPKQRCIITPPTRTSRLFDRLDVFVQLDKLLNPDAGEFSLQSVAMHGIGGVGKSSIASFYAEQKFSEHVYDVVLWVWGEKEASLRQSFTDIALRLNLPEAQAQSHNENQALVQDWFRVTKCKWLIIYDNVESAHMLLPYWPRPSPHGRAIITTRNHSLAFEPAASGIEITSWDTETGAEFQLFLLKKSIGQDIDSENTSARTLSEKLSGHALALSQMASLIYDGESKDKFAGFSAAPRKLTAQALIKRDKDSGILTVHRLVQSQFRYFWGPEQRQKFFCDTVTLLSYVMRQSGIEKGQLYDAWEGYNRYLQHVINLRDIFEEERKSSCSFRASLIFCDILNDYQRYLYENCAFEECERTCAVNWAAASTLVSEEDKTKCEGTIISHQAQVLEKLGNMHKAIEICQKGIDIRLGESPRKQILIAYSYCNLGIIYSSSNNFPKATGYFQESRQWWAAHFDDKGETRKYSSSILVSEARCLIGLGEFHKAEEMLDATIAQVREEKPLNFGTLA